MKDKRCNEEASFLLPDFLEGETSYENKR